MSSTSTHETSTAPSVVTNGHHRDVLYAWDLTPDERREHDVSDDETTAYADERTWVRYRGDVTPLGDYSSSWGLSRDGGLPAWLSGWDGYASDSFYSGTVVRFVDDGERVVVGRFCV